MVTNYTKKHQYIALTMQIMYSVLEVYKMNTYLAKMATKSVWIESR